MKPANITIPPEKMALYRATAKRRAEEEKVRQHQRFERAWRTATKCAELLRQQYKATRVVVFGSLLREELFHDRSDIDLAAWGTDEWAYYKAVAALLSVDAEFSVDFVRMEEARPRLASVINREGQEI